MKAVSVIFSVFFVVTSLAGCNDNPFDNTQNKIDERRMNWSVYSDPATGWEYGGKDPRRWYKMHRPRTGE
jgi:hypothetical protein